MYELIHLIYEPFFFLITLFYLFFFAPKKSVLFKTILPISKSVYELHCIPNKENLIFKYLLVKSKNRRRKCSMLPRPVGPPKLLWKVGVDSTTKTLEEFVGFDPAKGGEGDQSLPLTFDTKHLRVGEGVEFHIKL